MNSALVKPTVFYRHVAEKTKFNWFCYEYAAEIVSCVDADLRKRLNRKGISDQRIVDFAVYFAQRMKGPIVAKLAGEVAEIHMSHVDIAGFFPDLDDKQVDRLLTLVAKAWDSLLEVCSSCPGRCISERDRPAPAFDDPNL